MLDQGLVGRDKRFGGKTAGEKGRVRGLDVSVTLRNCWNAMYWVEWGWGSSCSRVQCLTWDVPETSLLVMIEIQGGGRMCNCDGIRGMIVVDEESGNWEHFWNVFFLGFCENVLNTFFPPYFFGCSFICFSDADSCPPLTLHDLPTFFFWLIL